MAGTSKLKASIKTKRSALMSLSDIHDMVKMLVTKLQTQQNKSFFVRLLTKSPRFSIGLGNLGDQVRNMVRASREDAHFFDGIEGPRLAKVFESSVVLPLSNFAFLLSPSLMAVTKKSEKKGISVAAGRLAKLLEELAECLRGKFGVSDKVNRPPMAYTRAQYLITRLRQVEKEWAPAEK